METPFPTCIPAKHSGLTFLGASGPISGPQPSHNARNIRFTYCATRYLLMLTVLVECADHLRMDPSNCRHEHHP